MWPAAAVGDRRSRNRDDRATWEGVADDPHRFVVEVGLGHWHDHGTIADVEVQVADGDAFAGHIPVREERYLDRLEPGIVQPRDVLRAALVVGVVCWDGLDQNAAVGCEGCDQIDMAVGVAVLDEALSEPDDALSAQVLRRAALRLRPATATGCGWVRAGTARWSGSCRRRR